MAGLSIDDMLEKVGSLGRYQLQLLFLLSYMEWVNVGFQVMLLTFVAAEPAWKCASNSSVCRMPGEFKPGGENYTMRCNMSRSDWEFTDSFTSVITEFDLVCDKAVLGSVSSSVVFAGWLAASLLSGVLSDKIGRKPVLFVFVFFCALFGLIGAFPTVFWFFTLCRFLAGVGVGGCGMPLFVIVTEFVGVRHRHVAGTSLWYSWTLSLMSLAGIAYLVRDWRTLSIICAVPGLPVVLGWWFVPESARYLILKGKVKETEKIMRDIAKTNRKEYPSEPLADLTAQGVQKMGDVRDLFRTKRMAHRTLVSWYSWFVNALVYYGVSFASPSLGGNMYFNFFLTSIIEIPANYACIYLMGKFGRKKPLVIGLILASFASIGAVLLTMYDPGNSDGFQAGRIVMAMTAKFMVMMSFDTIYVYAAELFPTVIRNIGMGTSTAAARIGSFSAPYVVNLNRIHPLLPFGIMAVQALLAGLLCMTLPETKGMALSETMDLDGEVIANNVVIPLDDTLPQEQQPPKPEEKPSDTVHYNSHANLVDGENNEKEMGVVNTAF